MNQNIKMSQSGSFFIKYKINIVLFDVIKNSI